MLIIGDGMADDPVPQLNNKTPLQTASIPAIDHLAAKGIVGRVVNCPPPLPAGSETAILSIFGCDPKECFTGRSPMEAAAAGIAMKPGDAAFRCNLVAFEDGDMPVDEKRILSHSAGSIDGGTALETVSVLLDDPRFAKALADANMEIHPFPAFRQIAVQHACNLTGIRFAPPHDHLGEKTGPYFPAGNERAEVFANLMRLAHEILDRHPVSEKRRMAGKLPANGIWFWAEGTTAALPSFRSQYGLDGAVVSAVPLCHGIGALRGLEMVEVNGATGELDTNFQGKLDAVWEKLQEYDFVCLHLEAPDECTHNGDLPGKLQAIEWLDSKLTGPLVSRLEQAGIDFRLLLLSDHKTLTATRRHGADPVPFLLYDSRRDSGRGGVYDEPAGERGPFVENGSVLLDLLFERTAHTIRREREEDHYAVEALVKRAFWNQYVPGCHEHYLAHAMRSHPDFLPELSLVAEDLAQGIIGCILYTKSRLTDENGQEKAILTFGPIAVDPSCQRQGIGKELMSRSFQLAAELGYEAIVIFGNPDNYVGSGFRSCLKYKVCIEGNVYPAAMLVKELKEGALSGHCWTYAESGAYQMDMAGYAAFDKNHKAMNPARQPSQETFYILSHAQLKEQPPTEP